MVINMNTDKQLPHAAADTIVKMKVDSPKTRAALSFNRKVDELAGREAELLVLQQDVVNISKRLEHHANGYARTHLLLRNFAQSRVHQLMPSTHPEWLWLCVGMLLMGMIGIGLEIARSVIG